MMRFTCVLLTLMLLCCAGYAALLGNLERTTDVALASDIVTTITNISSTNAHVIITQTNRDVDIDIDLSYYITGTPVLVESDPAWTGAQAVGFAVGGDISMQSNSISDVESIEFVEGSISGGSAASGTTYVVIHTNGAVSIWTTNNSAALTVNGGIQATSITADTFIGNGSQLSGLMDNITFTGDVSGASTNLQLGPNVAGSNELDNTFLDARYYKISQATNKVNVTDLGTITGALWAAISTNYEGIVLFTNTFYTALTNQEAVTKGISNRVVALESIASPTSKVPYTVFNTATSRIWGAIGSNATLVAANSNNIDTLETATNLIWRAIGSNSVEIGAASNALRTDITALQDADNTVSTNRFDTLYVADLSATGAEMVVNGAFTNDSDWTIVGGNILSERVVVSYDTCTISPITPLSLITAGIYNVSFDVTESSGSATIMLGGDTVELPTLTAGEHKRQLYTSKPGSNLCIRVDSPTGVQALDNISVHVVTGGNMWVAGDLRVRGSVYGTAAISEADPVWCSVSDEYVRVDSGYTGGGSVVLTNTPIADSMMIVHTNSLANWDISFAHGEWGGYAGWNNGMVFNAIDGALPDIQRAYYTGTAVVVVGAMYRWDMQFAATNAPREYRCEMGGFDVTIVPTGITQYVYFYAYTTNAPTIDVSNFTESTCLTNLDIYRISDGNLFVATEIINSNIVHRTGVTMTGPTTNDYGLYASDWVALETSSTAGSNINIRAGAGNNGVPYSSGGDVNISGGRGYGGGDMNLSAGAGLYGGDMNLSATGTAADITMISANDITLDAGDNINISNAANVYLNGAALSGGSYSGDGTAITNADAAALRGYSVSTAVPDASDILQLVGGVWTPMGITNLEASVTNESDPVFTDWLDTNTYAATETDPIFGDWLDTNTYVAAESDPDFADWLDTNAAVTASAWSGYEATNNVSMAGHNLTNANTLGATNIMLYDPDADEYKTINVSLAGKLTYDGSVIATGTPSYSSSSWATEKAVTNVDMDSFRLENIALLSLTNSQYTRSIGIDTVTGWLTGSYFNASMLGGLTPEAYATGDFVRVETDPVFTNWLETNVSSEIMSGLFEPSISITGQAYSSVDTVSGIYQRVGNIVNASFQFNAFNIHGASDCYITPPYGNLDTTVSCDAKIHTHNGDSVYFGSLTATNVFGTNLFEITDVMFAENGSDSDDCGYISTRGCNGYVERVTSPNSNGFYASGSTITLWAVFSKPVYTVLGTPQIGLEMDVTNRNAFYTNTFTLPSKTLAFDYVVTDPDCTWDLDYPASNSLAGGGIMDGHMYTMATYLPQPRKPGSLSVNKSFCIGHPNEHIYSVRAKEDGYYYTGDTVTVQVVFREDVATVSGTPFLWLNLENREVRTEITGEYLTNGLLNFEYIVQAGDRAFDLNYVSSNSFVITNGIIWAEGFDPMAEYDWTNTIPTTNSSMSLGGSSEVHINYPKKYSTFECMYKVED